MSGPAFAHEIKRVLGAAPDVGRIVPNRIVRFATLGKRGDDAGWCKLFSDGQAGVFGCWRTGEKHIWRETACPRPLSSHDKGIERKRIAAAIAAAAEEEAARTARASNDAIRLWSSAAHCEAHPYLTKKQIAAYEVRVIDAGQCKGHFFSSAGPLKGSLLLIAIRDVEGRLHSLQAIDNDGRKSFLRGSRTFGLFAAFDEGTSESSNNQISICEGAATALTLLQYFDVPAIAALSAQNLEPVARSFRAKFPKRKIMIFGDDDPVGRKMAEAAALAIGAGVTFPPLNPVDVRRGLTDWNDFVTADLWTLS